MSSALTWIQATHGKSLQENLGSIKDIRLGVDPVNHPLHELETGLGVGPGGIDHVDCLTMMHWPVRCIDVKKAAPFLFIWAIANWATIIELKLQLAMLPIIHSACVLEAPFSTSHANQVSNSRMHHPVLDPGCQEESPRSPNLALASTHLSPGGPYCNI